LNDLKYVCSNCNHTTKLDESYPRCPICNEPLNVEYIEKGKINKNSKPSDPFWVRYKDFYPYLTKDYGISLGEGFTPLVKIDYLRNKLNLANVFVKNETQNPTWSFKDRGSVIGVINALRLGYSQIGTVSTGNMAASVAAYGAKANLKTTILVKEDMAKEKLNPIAIYGPKVLQVKGDYAKLYDKSLKIGKEKDIAFINSDVPMRVEGSKSIAFEICEQLEFDTPDYVIVPTSAGGNFRGIVKGFIEFKNAGLITKLPTFICVQSAGAAPIATAYIKGEKKISHFGKTDTISPAIGNPNPPSGNEVLRLLERYNGLALTVNNDQIKDAHLELAHYGIFTQPAGAVPLAAVYKLMNEGIIKENQTVVMIATGSGLKDTKAFNYHNLTSSFVSLDDLDQVL